MTMSSIVFSHLKNIEKDYGQKPVFIHPGPWFHVFGLQCLNIIALSTDSKLVFMPKYTLETFLEAIEKYRVCVAYVVPPIMVSLVITYD